MNRRQFLHFGLSACALGALSGCNKILGLNMANSHSVEHSQHSMGMMAEQNPSLLPISRMPKGALLAPLALLNNQSTRPQTFQAQLIAKKTLVELVTGEKTEFWSYNDQVPGPQIIVNEGDTVEIQFTNQLSQPTTIHWHGLLVPPDQDGNPHDPVLPMQSRLYRFTLPTGSAGTYWYHTHAHELSAEQAYRGLAGSLIVRAKDDPLSHLPEQHWFFSDLRLDAQAQIPDNNHMDWMNGREGQFVLINGQYQPNIHITGTERIRIWNACNARYLNLSIPNCEFIVVGTDGGALEKPALAVTNLLIAPAERYEVLIRYQKAGSYPLNTLAYNRQKMMVDFQPETTVLAQISASSVNSELQLPQQLRTILDFGIATSYKKVTFSEQQMNSSSGMMNMSGMGDMQRMKGMFYVNERSFDMNRIDLTSNVGEVEEWTIINNSHMDHPFHIHGTQFIILYHEINGQKTYPSYRALKDTVNLRPYEQIRIKMVQQNTGLRMFHCHILEHESSGMMAQLKVV